MDWDKAWLFSKAIFVVLIRISLLFGTVAAACATGAITYAIYSQGNGGGFGPVAGVLAAGAVFCAGLAGRAHLSRELLPLLGAKEETEQK